MPLILILVALSVTACNAKLFVPGTGGELTPLRLVLSASQLKVGETTELSAEGGLPPYQFSVDPLAQIRSGLLTHIWKSGNAVVQVVDSLGSRSQATVELFPGAVSLSGPGMTDVAGFWVYSDRYILQGSTSGDLLGTHFGPDPNGSYSMVIGTDGTLINLSQTSTVSSIAGASEPGDTGYYTASAFMPSSGWGAFCGSLIGADGYANTCLERFSRSGERIWATNIGNTNTFITPVTMLASAAGVYLAGSAQLGTFPGATLYGTTTGGTGAYLYHRAIDGTSWAAEIMGGSSTTINVQQLFQDSSGNLYMTGGGNSTAIGATLIGTGSSLSYYFTKFSSTGTHLWTTARRSGVGGITSGRYSDVDNGRFYVAGSITGTPYSGMTQLGVAGARDPFINAYSTSNGLETYSIRFGAGAASTSRGSIAGDATRTYAFGETDGTIGTQNGVHGTKDMYVLQLDATGAFNWRRQLGAGVGTSTDQPTASVVSDGILLFTTTTGTLGTRQGTAGARDGVFLKYDSSGNLSWSRQWGPGPGSYFNSMTLFQGNDGTGYLVGDHTGDVGVPWIGTQGTQNILLTRIRLSTGEILWSRQIGDPMVGFYNHKGAIAPDGTFVLLLTGSSEDVAFISKKIGPGGSNASLILKFDLDGNLR